MKNVIIFTVGAGVGSLLTWMFVKDYYKKIADEEIESVVERFKDRRKEETVEKIENDKVNDDSNGYTSIIDSMDYSTTTNYSNDDDLYTVKVEEKEEFIKPMIIDADEFGDEEGYDTETLTYYSDGIIADDDGDLVFEHETLIGDALEHFDEDNLVYVRNVNELCDYEIYKDSKTYKEVFGSLVGIHEDID